MTMRPISICVAVWCGLSGASWANTTIAVDVPISISAAEVQAGLEPKLPTAMDAWGAWTYFDHYGLKWKATRSPLQVAVTSTGFKIETLIDYTAAGCPHVFSFCGPIVSCGDGEPQPQLSVTVNVTGAIRSNWSIDLHLDPTVTPVAKKHCKVTFGDVDASDHIAKILEDRIRAASRSFSFQSAAEKRWAERSVKLLDGNFWLVIRPREISIDALAGAENALTTVVKVKGEASVLQSAARPTPLPLPPLTISTTAAAPSKDFHVGVSSSWSSLLAIASKAPLPAGDHSLQIDSLGSAGGDSIAVGATVDGVGSVRVIGKVRYDTKSDEVVVQSLHGDIPAPTLTGAANMLLARLAAKLHWKVEPLLHDLVRRVGVASSGRIITTVAVTADGLAIDATFPGRLHIP